jgi:hypothetical protein
MMSVLEKIHANNITSLHISDADDKLLDNSHKLIEALEQILASYQSNLMATSYFLGCLRSNAQSKLVKVIGKIPFSGENSS